MRLENFPMLEAVIDSFARAWIRFWDNRFKPRDNPAEWLIGEVSYLRRRNEELTAFILNSIEPKTVVIEDDSKDEELQSLGRPIESSIQRRKRLEHDSMLEWNKMVQEAKNQLTTTGTTKTNEELEKDLGVKN